MSLSTYLAQKYLTASPSTSSTTSKKRKRKTPSTSSGLIIADDDALGWSTTHPEGEEDEDSNPLTINSCSAEFRKNKKSGWKVVGTPALQPKDSKGEEAEEAERIIAEASRERRDQGGDDDEGPVVEDEAGVVKMGDGTHAGLQRAGDVKRQFEKRKREELEAWEAEERAAGRGNKKGKGKGKGAEEETVYRDATGRRIDISMRKKELRKELDEKAKREAEEKEAQRGDVQMAMKEKRREELDEARFMPLARGVEDEELNRELRERERWDDPAMQFVKRKEDGKSVTGRPLYQGPWQPNRYGIRPGHRWDGVDRGNGWEGERFRAGNRREREGRLRMEWEMDE